MRNFLKRYTEKAGSAAIDYFSAFLLSFASCIVILSFTGQEAGFWLCAAYAACAVCVCLLFSVRRLALPLLLAVPLLFAATLLITQAYFEPAYDYMIGFVNWLFSGFPQTEPYSFDFSIHLVRTLLLIPAAAVFCLFFRKLYAFLPLFLLSAACTVYAQINKLPLRYALLAALLTVNLTALAHTAHRTVKKKLKGKMLLPEPAMRTAAAVFSVIAVLSSVLLSSAPDGRWRSAALHHFTADISDFVSYHFRGTGKSSGFRIGWSGFSPLGDKLGGDIDPDPHVTIRVQTETPALLMGSVYDTYDGERWYDTGTLGNFRYDSLLWRTRRRDAFAFSNPPGGREAAALYQDITTTAEMKLTPQYLYRNLFTAGQPLSWEFGEKGHEAYFNNQGELYLEEAPSSGVNYTFRTRVFRTGAEDFEEKLLELEKITLSAQDPLYDGIAALYCGLPEDLPQSVFEHALTVTEGADTPAEKAFAIRNWLRKNCVYTMTPGDTEAGRDFVDAFLRTREGYCTYYASAMAVLARCAGLPARYVTGFGLKLRPEADKSFERYDFIATHETAHAWAEIYLQGIGWVPFDATGYDPYEEADLPEETDEETDTGLYGPDRTDESIPSELSPENGGASQNGSGEGFRIRWSRVLLPLSAALLVFLALRFRLRRLSVDPPHLLKRIQRRFRGRKEQAEALFARVLDQLGYTGLYLRSGETLHAFCERAEAFFERKEDLNASFGAVERLYYGMEEPSDEDLAALARFSVQLEERIRLRLGPRAYFWRRAVFSYNPHRNKQQ